MPCAAFPGCACGVRILPPAACARRPLDQLDNTTPAAVASEVGKSGHLRLDGDFYAARPVEVLGLAARGGLLAHRGLHVQPRDRIARLLDGLAKLA